MISLSITDIRGMNGLYSIILGDIKKNIRITDDSLVIFNKVKVYGEEDLQEVKEQEIYISKQKTGFGEKSFFNCPVCGERRVTLYKPLNKKWFRCRSCLDNNIYKERCNAYDAGGTAIIEYKFNKLITKLDLSNALTKNHIPFDCRFYWPCKPKYMRYEEFELILKQLTALSAMRDTAILQKAKYSAKSINIILNSNKLKKLKLIEIPNAIWCHLIL